MVQLNQTVGLSESKASRYLSSASDALLTFRARKCEEYDHNA
jgi:hypothetical protein